MAVRKVLHVIPSVGPLRGGPSVMVRGLAQSLARAGVETHIATTDDNGPGKLSVRHGEPVVQDGVTYWYFPRQLRFYTSSWPLNVWLSNRMGGFDLLHIHALFSFAALPASFWAIRRAVPYIVRPLGTLNEWGMTHRRPWLKRASFRLVESRILAGAALVHYTSDQERREAEALGVATESTVIPNPLTQPPLRDLRGTFCARYKELRGRKIILFLSRLDRKKGLDLLLRAFAQVRQQRDDVTLIIAGEGDARFTEELKADARNLGIAGDVVWTGFLTGDAKQAAFADADLFVLPSYSENFGIAVAEAMAAGLPVLVTDQVGISQQIIESAAGVVVRCDARELAFAMTRLLGDDALCRSMGDNGRHLAASTYSEDAVTGMMLAAYNRIAG